ncbi:MAG: hypothetical protein EPO26_11985 [Chloroflexota bacterium]|nr:MAG: hypothetical protein EPO26_11985 [Chloroflexota bacterium]
MPKKRVPGHLRHVGRGRRKWDSTPNIPSETPADGSSSGERQSGVTPPVRPTQRRSFVPPARPTLAAVDLDYTDVKRDLRQIVIVSAIGFAVLIALTFVLQ